MMVMLTTKEFDLLIKALEYSKDTSAGGYYLADMTALKDKLEALKINIGRG